MIAHLGPGIDRTREKNIPDKGDESRSKAGQALLQHILQYQSKGFYITRVTTDGESSIKSVRSQIEALGVDVNILGHGSHAPHAESAIRHVKNKGRAIYHSLQHKIGRCSHSFRRSHYQHGPQIKLARTPHCPYSFPWTYT